MTRIAPRVQRNEESPDRSQAKMTRRPRSPRLTVAWSSQMRGVSIPKNHKTAHPVAFHGSPTSTRSGSSRERDDDRRVADVRH